MLCNFWMDEYSRTHHFQASALRKGTRCGWITPYGFSTMLTVCRWQDAVVTLAKLHRISPSSVGLSSFGKPSGFYNRQIKTFNTISVAQAQAVDVETRISVGNTPHYEDVVKFLRDPESQPQDRASLIHGDYKIDNLIYHQTEPRIIGILE